MIAASEVATATCMRYSSGTPAKRSEYSSTGTVTMPPPTPRRPAANPATSPDTARMAMSGRSSVKLTNAASRGALTERTPRAGRGCGMDFPDDRERDGLGRASADVETHGRAQTRAQGAGVVTQVAHEFFAPCCRA